MRGSEVSHDATVVIFIFDIFALQARAYRDADEEGCGTGGTVSISSYLERAYTIRISRIRILVIMLMN